MNNNESNSQATERIRTTITTPEFEEFLTTTDERVKNKFAYIIEILETQKIISQKFVKSLTNTEFYELRVSVGANEYRTIIFTIDAENIIEAKEVILLYSFQKKSTKDYKKAVEKARNIYFKYLGNETD